MSKNQNNTPILLKIIICLGISVLFLQFIDDPNVEIIPVSSFFAFTLTLIWHAAEK